MKETEYAEKLIIDYYNITACDVYNGITWKMAIQCAIIDVENTIGALGEVDFCYAEFDNVDEGIKYHENVLQILKDKL